MNIRAKRYHLVTFGYIPMIRHMYEPRAKHETSATIAELFQCSLFFSFRRCMEATLVGCSFLLADGKTINVSPCLLLHSGYNMEERSLISRKHHGSKYNYTPSTAALETLAGRGGLNQLELDMTKTALLNWMARRCFDHFNCRGVAASAATPRQLK